jgi:hypothetical protein
MIRVNKTFHHLGYYDYCKMMFYLVPLYHTHPDLKYP